MQCKRTDFYDVMPQSQRAIRQRHITSGHVTRFDEIRLAVGIHVETDDRPRDHVPDDDDNKYEQIFHNVAVPQQDPLGLSRLKFSQDPAYITTTAGSALFLDFLQTLTRRRHHDPHSKPCRYSATAANLAPKC